MYGNIFLLKQFCVNVGCVHAYFVQFRASYKQLLDLDIDAFIIFIRSFSKNRPNEMSFMGRPAALSVPGGGEMAFNSLEH